MRENKSIINIPKHVSIIMDGNRRWAKNKGFPALKGHWEGANNFERIVDYAKELRIECISAWAFSTENWKRDKDEVEGMFNLIRKETKRYKEKCIKEKIRFVHLGRKDRLPQDIVETIKEMEEVTKDFDSITIALGIDYGGHDELIRTVNKLLEKKLDITLENIERNLDTGNLPQIDLIIRTGGEKRLSGFMSWQCEYAEFYFCDTYFPVFSKEEFYEAIESFSNRDRRFGGDSTTKDSI